MKLDARQYYLDFWTVPAAIVAAFAFMVSSPRLNPEIAASCFVAGALGWSFLEYWIHRGPMHNGELRQQHKEHHNTPRERIGASSYLTLVIMAALAFGLPLVFNMSMGLGGFMGLAFGYLFYILVHHRCHHGPRSLCPVLRALQRNHELHHRRWRLNYGVSSPLWDIVFGTYRHG